MAARTGAQFLAGIRDGREVWLGGDRVPDVTAHPALAGAAASLAGLYDLQYAQADRCLMPNPATGEPMHVSHLIPRCYDDLMSRHAGIEAIAERTLGLMGRSPDYVNVTLAGFAGRRDLWAINGNDEGAANLVAFHQEVAGRDLCLTHALINQQIDKAVPEHTTGGGEIVLHKVEDTSNGILVRGIRTLATLAPFSDEMFVYPGQPIAKDAGPYALTFSIPMNTPGLKVLCRDSFSVPSNRFDHPFSSRFDEQDAVVIFDNVEVPRHRVFIDGDPEIYNTVMRVDWAANILQQTTLRAAVKLEFAYQLASRMVEVVNGANPQTNEMLGELWSYAEMARSAVRAAEANAREWGNGVWFCDDAPLRAIRPHLPRWFPRVNEIIKLLGAHSLLATPTASELANAELRPLIDLYYQGANGIPAEERIKVFRAAWDFAGTALGGRNELYERFYLASAARNFQIAHAAELGRRKANPYPLLNQVLTGEGAPA
ncbi:MAG: 4-hydroxyphenylacetate 3-hydroxylase [Chloroflexi bacterium]|nr:4-hydroxyphenylacetate 3-hydroxylase [Chloroflexota bacterium]